MANQEEIFDGKSTIETVLQLIRYDIPVLTLGKSSIGKSYTLIDITKKWNITHSLLYIGSEKSENIEGVPKLTERKEGKEILEYLKPYWFPNAEVISQSVSNGRKLFEKYIKNYYDGDFNYSYEKLNAILNGLSYISWNDDKDTLRGGTMEKEAILIDINEDSGTEKVLNDKPFPMIKVLEKRDDNEGGEEVPDEYFRDDLKDFCNYITTVLGYGNFWLILDEIDKVEKYDKDKFAPLLHIVRERTLKNFRMIDINDGKGVGVPSKVKGSNNGYEEIAKDLNMQLDNNQSVLDTRVMAIANKTENIEEALFRRFVQIVAEDLLIWRKSQINLEQSTIESCISAIKSDMSKRGIEQGDYNIEESLVQRIDEINLQWQYNFLPKIMNKNDVAGNFFVKNIMSSYAKTSGEPSIWNNEKQFTALYKILEDNFQDIQKSGEVFDTADRLFDCLIGDVIQNKNIGEDVKQQERQNQSLRGEIEQLKDTFGNLEDVADDIADKMRNYYDEMVVNQDVKNETKAQGLTNWTEMIINYIEAVLYTTDGEFVPLEASKYLVPALVNVFYTEMANDKNSNPDTVASVTSKFQKAFYNAYYKVDSVDDLVFDKKSTEKALYGDSVSELKGLEQSEINEISEEALIPYNNEAFYYTAQNKIGQMSMGSSFVNFIGSDFTKKENKAVISDFKTKDSPYYGVRVYVIRHFSKQIEAIRKSFVQRVNLNKGTPKEKISLFSLKILEAVFVLKKK